MASNDAPDPDPVEDERPTKRRKAAAFARREAADAPRYIYNVIMYDSLDKMDDMFAALEAAGATVLWMCESTGAFSFVVEPGCPNPLASFESSTIMIERNEVAQKVKDN